MKNSSLYIQVAAIVMATVISFFVTRWLEKKYEDG